MEKPMNILVVSQYFWPENFRVNDLCAEMIKKGYSVTILTGEPNYTTGRKDQDYLDNKDKYNNYNGCEIVRVPLLERGDGKLQLICNYISYFISASTIGLWKLRKKNFDVVFVCQLSPVTIAIPAIIYRKIYSVPVVMWVLDLWPDSLKAVGTVKSEKILSIVNKLVRIIYNRCDLILGQSRSFVRTIEDNCSSSVNVDYFPSWAESIFEEQKSEDENINLESDSFNILFAGNVGEAQDFPTILKALELLKLKSLSVKLHVVGDGRNLSKVREEVLTRELTDYVEFWGRYPLDDMPAFYRAADVLFVSLKSSPTFSMTIPGKVQSYMMAEKPILASLEGEGEDAVLQSGCGLVSAPGHYNKLAENIEKMLCMQPQELLEMGAKGKEYASNEFDRDTLMLKLFEHFENVAVTKS